MARIAETRRDNRMKAKDKQEKANENQEETNGSKRALFASGAISVRGASVHNLKRVDTDIPRHKFTVVTGLSGSGKSSLVFDVLLAEGRRRYIETFSSYARTFLSGNERPEVESIDGLSPVVAIEQKTASTNPRSTVGTITEIWDFIRLLYARCGTPYSQKTGKALQRFSEEELIRLIQGDYSEEGIEILAPIVRGRKGHYRELLDRMRRKGYLNVLVDGAMRELTAGMKLDRYKTHDVAVMIDKFVASEAMEQRIGEAVRLALREGDGMVLVRKRTDGTTRLFSTKLIDLESGISYEEPSPATFSFNSPRGWCPHCKGLGTVHRLDRSKLVTDGSASIAEGGFPLLKRKELKGYLPEIKKELAQAGFGWNTPLNELPDELMDKLINGEPDADLSNDLFLGAMKYLFFNDLLGEDLSLEEYASSVPCPQCGGSRLSAEARSYRIGDWGIADLNAMECDKLLALLPTLKAAVREQFRPVAGEIVKEIETRLRFLVNVGLDYLSLERTASSLSGGESQRIRLAAQIGTGLVEVLYLLDEPGIGLHKRDSRLLIDSLKKLRDGDNTIVVVEHDRDMMLAADYLIDLGPGAGRLGGKVVFQGTPEEIVAAHTITADYLNGIKRIEVPKERRKGNGHFITLKGATGNNLKGDTFKLPLGCFVCVTGVSGSGKSSIVNGTLVPAVRKLLYRALEEPLPYKAIEGLENIDKIAVVDQSPLGRTPRSNPATYTGLFTDIRKIFVALPESRARGYKPGRFSFNVAGGRCEECKGNGYKTIGMRFLPDVTVPCSVCNGRRYSRETLEVRYKGKSIADVLDMTFNQAAEFFENIPSIAPRLEVMRRVGLGYIKLGQPSITLSGGESQRVKLAGELSKRDTGKTLYILDEPTTGLHFDDIRLLLNLISGLVDRGNTVLVIEHDMDVIKSADWIIDMGPEGGDDGGKILFEGTPEALARKRTGYTGSFLKEELNRWK